MCEPIVNLAQLLLRDEAGEVKRAPRSFNSRVSFLKFVEQWSFAGNRQRRISDIDPENCESAKGNWQTFLLDQPAGLHKSPFTVVRKAPFAERKFL